MDAVAEAERTKYEKVWESAEYRTVSPGAQALDELTIADDFVRFGVKTILDAGCGSGGAIRWLEENCAGSFDEVHGVDIAKNCLDEDLAPRADEIMTVGCLWDELPKPKSGEKWDAVFCCDVLEHIPTDKVPVVLENFRRSMHLCGFLGIALFPDAYGKILVGEPLHLTVRDWNWWQDRVDEAGLRIVQARVRKVGGRNAWAWLTVAPKA